MCVSASTKRARLAYKNKSRSRAQKGSVGARTLQGRFGSDLLTDARCRWLAPWWCSAVCPTRRHSLPYKHQLSVCFRHPASRALAALASATSIILSDCICTRINSSKMALVKSEKRVYKKYKNKMNKKKCKRKKLKQLNKK